MPRLPQRIADANSDTALRLVYLRLPRGWVILAASALGWLVALAIGGALWRGWELVSAAVGLS